MSDNMDKLLDQAIVETNQRTQFKLNLSGKIFDAYLATVDFFEIRAEQRQVWDVEFAKWKAKGYDKVSYRKDDWDIALKQMDDETRKNMKAPESYAHQLADQSSMMKTILQMMPAQIRTLDGNLLFPTKELQQKFAQLVDCDPTLRKLMFDVHGKLSATSKKIEEKVKN